MDYGPTQGESPTRPGILLVMPPVLVAAATLPSQSIATAPTVSHLAPMPESPASPSVGRTAVDVD